MADTITEDGEIVESTALAAVDVGTLATLARAEIDVQIATAHQFPRSVDRAIKNILSLATLDEETAAECCYALVRKSNRRGARGDEAENKPIEGPSIRLAEIAAACYGNCRIDARVIAVNRVEKYVEAEGTFHDLESNTAQRAVVRRRISTRSGGLFSDDMIVVTGNAACAIAKRNAILAGIPRGVYRGAYIQARKIIQGTVTTLVENRDKCYQAFARYGVKPEQLWDALGVAGDGDVKLDQIAQLRAMYASIQNGDQTVEEIFAPAREAHERIVDPLSDKPSEATTESTADQRVPQTAAVGAGHPTGHVASVKSAAPADSSAADVLDDDAPAALSLIDEARAKATNGKADFEAWFNTLKPEQLDELKPHMKALSAAAKEADKAVKS